MTPTATNTLKRLRRLRPLIKMMVSDGPNSDEISIANASHTSAGPAATYCGPNTCNSGVEKKITIRYTLHVSAVCQAAPME